MSETKKEHEEYPANAPVCIEVSDDRVKRGVAAIAVAILLAPLLLLGALAGGLSENDEEGQQEPKDGDKGQQNR